MAGLRRRGDGGRELAIMVVPAADAGDVLSGMADAWRGIFAGGTGDLLDLVSDDGIHDLMRQRRTYGKDQKRVS